MQLTAYEIALIAGGFGIVGALLGTLLSYRLAIKLANINAANAAKQAETNAIRVARSKLRAALATVLAQLDLGRKHNPNTTTYEAPDVDRFLMTQLPSNAAAIEEFRPFVSERDMAGYDQAWGEYYEVANGGLFVQRHIGEQNPHSAIQKKIHAIISYAKT